MALDAKSKKVYLIGGAVGVVVVGFIYLHNRNSASVSAGAASAGNIDPATGYPYGSAQDQAALSASGNVDPTTGYPYGSVQDQEALATQGYGYGSAGALGTYTPVGTATTAVQTNAQWAQAAQQTLSAIGYAPETVAGAIGAYLARIPLTANQAAIVQVALAEEGPPPQGSYSIIQSGTPPTPTPGTQVAVPNIVGKRIDEAGPIIKAAGLKYSGPAPVKGHVVVITSQTPHAGTKVNPGTTVRALGKTT